MKFSIRDLLLVTVIVALGVGWWIERTKNLRLQTESKTLVEQVADLERHNSYLRHLGPLSNPLHHSFNDGFFDDGTDPLIEEEPGKKPRKLPTSR